MDTYIDYTGTYSYIDTAGTNTGIDTDNPYTYYYKEEKEGKKNLEEPCWEENYITYCRHYRKINNGFIIKSKRRIYLFRLACDRYKGIGIHNFKKV